MLNVHVKTPNGNDYRVTVNMTKEAYEASLVNGAGPQAKGIYKDVYDNGGNLNLFEFSYSYNKKVVAEYQLVGGAQRAVPVLDIMQQAVPSPVAPVKNAEKTSTKKEKKEKKEKVDK